MKTTLLLVAATVTVFTAVNTAFAAEPLLSPRAKANQTGMVRSSSSGDVNLITNRPIGNARAWAHAQSLQTVPSTGPTIDLAHGQRPTLSPKDPRYEQVTRELREAQFQVAPLK